METESSVIVSISLSADLLNKIERNIAGVSTNDKLLKCILRGYEILTNPKKARK